jgi:hypothetical protein
MTSATVSTIQLFERYADGIYTLGVRMLRDRHLAEDLVQDTLPKSCRLIVDETNQVRVAARKHGRVEMPDDVRARIRGSLEEEQARG